MANGLDLTPEPVPTVDESMNKALPASKSTGQTGDIGSDHNSIERAEPPMPVSHEAVPDQPSQIGIPDDLRCPNCDRPHHAHEMVCMGCGAVFSTGSDTQRFDSIDIANLARGRNVGKAVTDNLNKLTFYVAGESITPPASNTITIGRSSSSQIADNSAPPDVDLKRFKAHVNGVSRQHVRITRNDDLVRVTDLGSTNGTFLNGLRLVPHQERVLRNGDELVLGRLKIYVRF